MKEQSEAYNPDGSVWVKDHSGIYQHGRPCMKRVESYAAPPGLKNRRGQQMVEVNSHSQEHKYPCF